MQRLLPLLVLPAALLFTSPEAHAGPGAILKALSKLGKGAAKAGKGGVAAKGLKGGGAALHGAKALGALGAAEAVFRHAPLGGSRVGLFLADDGAGALKVVTEAGEEISQSASGLRKMVGELDEMAAVADDAGVDLFLDPDVLHRIGDLELGPNTRLWLANTAGPSLPLRTAANSVPEVAVALDGAGGGRFWLRLGTESAQLALRLAMMDAKPDEVLIADGECTQVDGATVGSDPLALIAESEGVVVLLSEGPLEESLVVAAQDQGVDLIAVQLDVCAQPGELEPTAIAALGRAETATTAGELWAIAATASATPVLDDIAEQGDWLALRGVGLLAVHRVSAAIPAGDDDPPAWFIALALLAGLGWVVYKFRGAADPEAA